ncbi:MAG: hypothetical protein PUD38_04255 [Firmicutes bacterium]|nr:hypothetical protein [Bacillota bacterium]
MEFMTVLKYAVMIIETGALIGALTFLSRAFKERQNAMERKKLTIQGAIYAAVFVILNLLRNAYLM